MLLAGYNVQAGGENGTAAGTGVTSGSGTVAAAPAAVSAGARTSSGGERASGHVEGGRISQSAGVATARAGNPVQSSANPRVVAGNQQTVRGTAARQYPVRYGNNWTDPTGTGRQLHYATRYQNAPQQNGYGRRTRSHSPYLTRYYGGYFPIYVDVPVGGYFDGSDYGDTGPDGGPSVAPDPGSPGAVVAPTTPAQEGDAQPDANSANPNQAAPDPAAADTTAPAANRAPVLGPDSLVEAVQNELARRGYFQGKVDAMFRPDTEAAVRKFQQDNYLAPTGHLNEPTLHALNLD